MGIQDSGDVALIRHAYVAPAHQGRAAPACALALSAVALRCQP
jgi:hypothetical protein